MIPEAKTIAEDVRRALLEDIGTGDVSALLIPANLIGKAKIIAREPLLFCGKPWIENIIQMHSSLTIHWQVEEGQYLASPNTLCEITGDLRTILTLERTLLNFIQTLSGTATQTFMYVQKLKPYTTRLLDTRKTLPGLRVAQKYAVACAGGVNHRRGLFDAFLIKENHIKACGSITAAVHAAQSLNKNLLIVVEVENLHELEEALAAKPDRILLDNFSLSMLRQAVAANQPKVCDLEASGGITLEIIEEVAETGVDYISVGSITKSLRAIDLSLLLI
jgi:nicotinate-nucleotide pyrophosphorylase (carboxylating)